MAERRITPDGRILEKQADGTVIVVGTTNGRGPAPVTLGTPDPYMASEEARKAAAAKAAADKAERDRLEWLATHNPDGSPKVIPTPAQVQDQNARKTALDNLVAQINRVQTLGNQGPLATRGLAGLGDYNPWSSANAQFDTAGTQLSQQGLATFRIPGQGSISDRDAIMFDRANMPQASNLDASNLEILHGLRSRVEGEYAALGLPPPKWEGVSGIPGSPTPANVTPWDQESAPPGSPTYAAATGGTRTVKDSALSGTLNSMFAQGASLNDINAYLDTIPGAQKINPVDYANMLDYARKHPGYEPFTATRTEPLTMRQKISGSAPTAGVAGLADAASFGGLTALAPGQMAALSNTHPGAMLGGEIVGSIYGSKGLGALGRTAVGKLPAGWAAKILANTGKMNAARTVATDAAYGATYNGVANGDPVTGAFAGAGGSILGQGAGNILGRAFTGVTRAGEPLARLRAQGVVPTIGQIMRGRAAELNQPSFVASLEDAVSNTPGAGTLTNARRTEALAQANNAAYNKVSGGTQINGAGLDALHQLENAKNAAYAPLDSVTLPGNDPKFLSDMADARTFGAGVDTARSKGDFGLAMQHGVDPLIGGGADISGRSLQDIMRYTQGQSRLYTRAANGAAPDPSANFVADAFGNVNNAAIGLAARNAPDVIPALQKANRINRGLSVLDDAAVRADSNDYIFTGGQLQDAIRANNGKFGGGRGALAAQKSPLAQLANDMQTVLTNKVPPTGVNAAPVIAGLGALSAGYGSATDNGTLQKLGMLALLASPYTKMGARVTASALLDRPASVKAAGAFIRKHKGLFGSASIPLLLESQK